MASPQSRTRTQPAASRRHPHPALSRESTRAVTGQVGRPLDPHLCDLRRTLKPTRLSRPLVFRLSPSHLARTSPASVPLFCHVEMLPIFAPCASHEAPVHLRAELVALGALQEPPRSPGLRFGLASKRSHQSRECCYLSPRWCGRTRSIRLRRPQLDLGSTALAPVLACRASPRPLPSSLLAGQIHTGAVPSSCLSPRQRSHPRPRRMRDRGSSVRRSQRYSRFSTVLRCAASLASLLLTVAHLKLRI